MAYPVLTDEHFKTLQKVRNHIASMAVQGHVFPNWSDEFTREEFNRTVNGLIGEGYVFDLSDVDTAQADSLGFGKWDESSRLRLFPLWIAPFINAGTRCASIAIGDDEYEEFDYVPGETDLDHRFGFLAFGPAFIDGQTAGKKVAQ